jgi:hypothetical protein
LPSSFLANVRAGGTNHVTNYVPSSFTIETTHIPN